MASIADELGIQSYCFRGFKDNAQVADKLTACGVNRIELCGVHVDFNDAASHQQVIDTYRDAGVTICSVGVENMNAGDDRVGNVFDFANKAGAKVVSVDFKPGATPDDMSAAAKKARAAGLQLGIHNHGGRHWLGNSQLLAAIFEQVSESELGLCLDTAWSLDAGENPVNVAEKFADRLHGVHIKDFVFDRARKPEDVVVGTGNLDLPSLLKAMKAGGFKGACVLEYEGDVDNPVPALTKCVEAVRAAAG